VAVKLAIAGKGGSGKTTVAGTMARLAAGRGVDVLAIDADLNPNLALVLGMRPEALDRVIPSRTTCCSTARSTARPSSSWSHRPRSCWSPTASTARTRCGCC
jgi:CO dehydrogenase nickel-insertion accessory protein CooC1